MTVLRGRSPHGEEAQSLAISGECTGKLNWLEQKATWRIKTGLDLPVRPPGLVGQMGKQTMSIYW